MRAIVVDDSTTMRSILKLVLRRHGFEVDEARNGRHALDVLSVTDPPDLALIDWNMPEMGGLELLRALRSNHSYDGTRVMMVTTETDMAQVRQALLRGADEYVMKPFNQEILSDKLRLMGF